MKKIAKWFFMLSKRLYKKPSFVTFLLLIPVCVFAFNTAAKETGGFANIVLAKQNPDDAVATDVINALINDGSIVKFTEADSHQEAITQVKNGIADEAWLFPENTAEEIQNFVKNKNNYVISVFTREQTSATKLTREKLTAKLFKYCAKAYYIDYVRTQLPQLDSVSDDKLTVYFDTVPIDETLFVYGNPTDLSQSTKKPNFLTSPIRGLLAILTVLCGMAATLFYMQDEKAGTFSYVKQNRKYITAFGCVATAVINVSAIVALSLCLTSLSANILKELAILVMFTLCVSAFCLLIKEIFSGINIYAALIPLFTVIFIGVCPVFFDFKSFLGIQLALPPTYYVNAVYDNSYFVYMPVYTAGCIALTFILKAIKKDLR